MKNYCEHCDKKTDIKIKNVEETYNIKGESITFGTEVAFCKECSNKTFNQELDNKTLINAYSIYRRKHNLLSPAEIIKIREKYRLSQRALSKLLEWGKITIHRYESGAIQDAVHNEVLMFIDNPKNMKVMLEKNGHLLSASTFNKTNEQIQKILNDEMTTEWQSIIESYLSTFDSNNQYSGFSKYNLEKIKNMILFLVDSCNDVFKTKLNKLLFYSDFLNCKKYSISISGSTYEHFRYGPVPKEYDLILASMISEGSLKEDEVYFPNGKSGTVYSSVNSVDRSLFSKQELATLGYIASYFMSCTSEQIMELSHKEKGYEETIDHEKISYKYAKDLPISIKNE